MMCVHHLGMVWDTANWTTLRCAPKIALHNGINNLVFKNYCNWSVFADTVTYIQCPRQLEFCA